MLQAIVSFPNSFGYVILPTLDSFKANAPNVTFTQLSICTVISDTDGSCLNAMQLDYELQTNSLSKFTIQANGAAMPPAYQWNCTDCWFFNGFTYWYTEEVYSLSSGCVTFLNTLNEILQWIYTDPTALEQSRNLHYYLPQDDQATLTTLQGNIDRISCADSPSSIIGVAFVYAWIVTISIILLFSVIICCRLAYGVRKKYKRIKDNPTTFSLQAEGPLEITPLLMSAQIDRKDIELTTQIGTGSFGEVNSFTINILPYSIHLLINFLFQI